MKGQFLECFRNYAPYEMILRFERMQGEYAAGKLSFSDLRNWLVAVAEPAMRANMPIPKTK